MPDVDTPQPLSDQVEELASGMFDPEVLGPELTLKCRYLYLHAKIESVQDRGESPADRHLQKLNELEEKLMEAGIRPSSLLEPTQDSIHDQSHA